MIERLHYLALPKVEESPRSVLLRTVTNNGFPSITHLTTRFNIQGVPFLALQTGSAPLIQVFLEEAGEYRDQFQSAFYTQKRGLTKAAPVTVMGTVVPVSMIEWKTHKICPQCLMEGYFRAIQDLEFIDVCPYHEIRYVTHCPECKNPFHWRKMQFSKCECGHELNPNKLPRVEGDAYGAKSVLEYLRNGDEQNIKRLYRYLQAFKFDTCNDPIDRIYLVNQAAMICDYPEEGTMGRFVNMQSRYPGLPPRALLAPFLTMFDREVRGRARKILQSCSPDLPASCQMCGCEGEYFSEPEVRTALGISGHVLNMLSDKGHIEKKTVGKRGVVYPYRSLCTFYKKFKISPRIETNEVILLCPPNTFGFAMDIKLNQLQNNKLILVEADFRRPIGNFQLMDSEVKPAKSVKRVVAPDGFVTVKQAAERFQVYVDAVREALKIGQISTRAVRGKSNTVYIPEEDVIEFDKEFIFMYPLVKQFDAQFNIFPAQLETAGVFPVSGPHIDGGVTPIYRRDDLRGLNLSEIATRQKFKTNSGRKLGDPELYDKSKWLRAIEAGNLLKISVQLLSNLKDYGLLVEGVPPGREADNTRYFTVESTNAAKQWLDGARKLADVAFEEGSTVRQIEVRFIRSGYVKPLYIGVWTLISADDVMRIQEHRKQYCTCAEAAAHIGAQTRHFNNMIKLGKITPVPPEESGVGSIILLRWSDIQKPVNV